MNATNNIWDEQVLWTKCKLYMDLALLNPREHWLFPFWAALSLDLLARTALSHIHPVLLASTPQSAEGRHVIYALNRSPKNSGNGPYIPHSIDSKEVYKRCAELVDNFTDDHRKLCEALIGRRNEELHSGGAPFVELPVQTWLPKFYECCEVLLQFTGRTLEDFLGKDEAGAGQAMIAASHDAAAKAVGSEIKTHSEIWKAMPPDEQRIAATRASMSTQRSLGHRVSCPACGSDALLEGEEIAALPDTIDGEIQISKSTVLATLMKCEACGLRIKGHNHVHAAGLQSTFTQTVRYSLLELYGVSEPDYEPDYNE
jgi:hypothetical protein